MLTVLSVAAMALLLILTILQLLHGQSLVLARDGLEKCVPDSVKHRSLLASVYLYVEF